MAVSVDRIFLKAKTNVKNGNIGVAKALYREILNTFPDNRRARLALASIEASVPAKVDEARAQERLDAALSAYSQGRPEDAIKQANALLVQFPKAVVLYNLLGVANTDLRRLDVAISHFDTALIIQPNFAEAYNNRGVALRARGDLGAAIESYGKAIKVKPGYAEAYNNLGNALKIKGDMSGATKSYKTAIDLRPDYAEAHNNLGVLQKDEGDLVSAIKSYARAVGIKPDYAEAYNNLGVAQRDAGDTVSALKSYNQALAIRPDFTDAHCNICEVHEKQNDRDALETALDAAVLACGRENSDILYRLAQLATRKKQYDVALACLKDVRADDLQPSIKESYFSLLGKTHDRLGQFDDAFAAFDKQNLTTKASPRGQKFNPDGYLETTRQMKDAWTTPLEPNWGPGTSDDSQPSPVFLVGFPRSGTTLLDTILRSHPSIDVLEEKPMVQAMRKAFGQAETIEILNGLSDEHCHELRTAYFTELENHADPSKAGGVIVDKLPLNIRHVGIIHRIFPRAKFILALRHPCDCVLSCYMQNFSLNDAMANFLSLEQSAKLYAAIMDLWVTYTSKLDMDVHLFRYEDLVRDLEATCKPLIAFLNLDWDDNLKSYRKTALNRTDIATPSYNQVIEPLYDQASGRWENYKERLKPVLPLLDPWVKEFGYLPNRTA